MNDISLCKATLPERDCLEAPDIKDNTRSVRVVSVFADINRLMNKATGLRDHTVH